MAVLLNVAGLVWSLLRTLAVRWQRGPLRPGRTLRLEALVYHLRRRMDALTPLAPDGQRAALESLVMPTKVSRRVRIETSTVSGAPGEWLIPPEAAGDGALLYLHGGGFVTGSLRSYRELAARLALASGTRVLLLDYRLAPEHPFPAAIDDAVAAAKALLAKGPLVLAGDSAGGSLCVVSLCTLRDEGGPSPAGAALISPFLDCELRSASIVENERFDILSRDLADAWVTHYLAGKDPRDTRASPLNANLHGLPPLLVQVGGAEMLHDEGVLFAKRAEKAGVRVKLEVEPDMPHDWHLLASLLPEGRRAIGAAGSFVRELLHAAAGTPPVD